MTSLFAQRQFGYGAYDPVRLDTGTLSVGANLPRLPRKPPNEKNPTDENPGEGSGGGISNAAKATVSAGAMQSALNAAPQMASAPAHASLHAATTTPVHATAGANAASAAMNAVSAPAPAGSNPFSAIGHWGAHTFDSARHGIASGADYVFTPNPTAFHDAGHWAAHTFDSARHGTAHVADVVNNAVNNPVVKDVMNFGNPNIPGSHAGVVNMFQSPTESAVPVPQDIPSSNLRLNPNSPVYEQAGAKALPRGWSGNSAIDSATSRPAIEMPGATADPLQSLIQRPPAYSAMPRGWSANVNPSQFNSAPEGSTGLPNGVSANGGWVKSLLGDLGDIADAAG